MGDVPKAVAAEDNAIDAMLASLEMGVVPSPEVAETPTVGTVKQAPAVETPKVDDPPNPAALDYEKQLAKSEQRFKTLEGMMKAGQKRQAEIIDGLEQQLAARAVAEAEAPLDVSTLLSEEEQAEFGAAGIAVLEKLAGAIAEKAISKKAIEVEHRLSDMQKRVDQAEANGSGNTTWDIVERMNPGAKAINATDAGWFAFLTEVDPVSGSLYREIGEAAAGVNDAHRLSELIDTYRASANLAKPVIPVKPNQAAVAPKNDGNRQTQSTKRTYSQDEVREFYDHRARGLRKGITGGLSTDEIEALEKDIDAAMDDGRIIL